MTEQSKVIDAFVNLGKVIKAENEELNAAIQRTYINNNWLITENYWDALTEWKSKLEHSVLEEFCAAYNYTDKPKAIGVIMAGNIPMVGFHDLLCVLLSGNKAVVKLSSDDTYAMQYLINVLVDNLEDSDRISVVERLEKLDGVIATGSNNSHKYFEHYFKDIPSILRKNRTSMAVLDGSENSEDLALLADDVFKYFGLGCRNVSFLMLPKTMDITIVLDAFMKYEFLKDHNKFANNYTYHRALLLMNTEQHLDTGFCLPKERKELNAPLACIHYSFYSDVSDVSDFISEHSEDIQCIVGNYSNEQNIPFGKAQKPELEDFADNVNTMTFLDNLN